MTELLTPFRRFMGQGFTAGHEPTTREIVAFDFLEHRFVPGAEPK